MRVKLTLDDDLVEFIAELARQSRKPFQTIVNEALRRVSAMRFRKNRHFSSRLLRVICCPVSVTTISTNWHGVSMKRDSHEGLAAPEGDRSGYFAVSQARRK